VLSGEPLVRQIAGGDDETMSEANDLPRPFGQFTLLRLIAQGGMGAVYLALRPVEEEESQMRRLPQGQEAVCVVKTVRADLKADREAIGRFLDEARVVQKLEHPRIARTLDAGIVDKTYFLCLEFISGRNLRDITTRAQKMGRALPEALMVHVVADMLDALDHAHRLKDIATGKPLNIVHRDVSPHNVMLGFDGNTKLIDFGLAAHELKRELTRPGVMVGKLRYNAPEQVRDKALDGRSDVYSAAVVLYEFIANERFYEGLPEEQVWRVAMKGDHRPPSWRDIDIQWRHLLDVALQNDPEKRYRSAGEFREALLDVAGDRGVDLKNMRREASRFVREAFAAEQASEREMILQATGIAEARTRLFRSPSEMQSALSQLGADRSMRSIPSDMKTQIFDEVDGKGVEHLRQLQDMMSRFAEPDAVTQLPAQPVGSADSAEASVDDNTFHVDDNADGSLSADAASASDHALANDDQESDSEKRTRPARSSARGSVSKDANSKGARPALVPAASPTTAAPRMQPRPPAPAPSTTPPRRPADPVSTNSALSRGSRSQPLPPLPPREAKKGSPLLALGLGLVTVALIGLAAYVAVPRLLRPQPGSLVPEADAGVAVLVPVDVPVDVPVAAADAGVVAVAVVDAGVAAVVVDAGAADVVDAVVDAGVDAAADVVDAGVKKRDPQKTPKKPPGPPPKKDPKSFKEQLEYLRTYCMSRVACARSLVPASQNLMSLSPEELRQMKDEAPKCVQRCQR
jgi:serine/threonine protein kinase